MDPFKRVIIIGGGFSGALIASHLARNAPLGQLKITLINPTPHIGPGLAYRFDDDNLLLNVPAGNMSALADEPGHFVAYCQRIDPSFSSGSFVSRRLYGQYLKDMWAQTLAAHPGVIDVHGDEAVALNRIAGSSAWNVALASGQSLQADHVVIATGHQAPGFPVPLDPESRACVIDPWDFAAMHQQTSDHPVVIVGTGHTAVDALLCLAQSKTRRRIYLLSRHGLLPHRHRLSPAQPKPHPFPDYLRDVPATARAYTRALRQHLSAVEHQGVDWRDALNELRPHTPSLWQSLPAAEQRRFLRHLQAHWDVHRHRLAPMAAQRLEHIVASGQAHLLAGRILSLKKVSDGIVVEYRPRGADHVDTLHASAVINCTGPNTNIQRQATPLLAQLLRAGLIQPDVHGLGLKVTTDCQVINAQQQTLDGLWYVGPLLKATLWEATAVPELRVHARRLASTFLNRLQLATAQASP
jgi:uncharacterized NAD(P)/FAD-binding protein YdhS